MEKNILSQALNETHWDCCVIGNGVSAIWLAHWLWTTKKSVLWVSSEELYSPERALLQHGWLWGANADQAAFLGRMMQGFAPADGDELPRFQSVWYDARNAKRFRPLTEGRWEQGAHERDYLSSLSTLAPDARDLWAWHARLHAFYDTGDSRPGVVELFSEPRFARVVGLPISELKTQEGQIRSVVIFGPRPGATQEISAKAFYLGDYDEYLPGLVKNEADSQHLAGALKGRSYRAGFGLRLWHKELEPKLEQTLVFPLVVNPTDRESAAHVAGRFVRRPDGGIESLWVGLLTDEELEDNHEILKKIKATKRAVDRGIAGFSDSVSREAVTFEPRMVASDLMRRRPSQSLGAQLLTDHFGLEKALRQVERIVTGSAEEVMSEEGRPEGQQVSETPKKASRSRRAPIHP